MNSLITGFIVGCFTGSIVAVVLMCVLIVGRDEEG